MGRIGWDVSTHRERLWRKQSRGRKGLWKRRGVEKSKRRLSHPAWKSRKVRGIPTFPQPRRRLVKLLKPDMSCATKTGHFNLLRTGKFSVKDWETANGVVRDARPSAHERTPSAS